MMNTIRKKISFAEYKSADFPQRTATVEPDVPNGLIDCAANIDYAAYSYSERKAMIAKLRSVVEEKLSHELRPRTQGERTRTQRNVAHHIPDDLLELFNDFKYPNIGAVKMIAYKAALMSWIKTNLSTL